MTASGVFDRYQTPRLYWWPGMTNGEQDWFSSVCTARSPLEYFEIEIFTAVLPECPRVLVPIEYVFLPYPYFPQHSGKPPGPGWLRPGLTTRLTPALAAELATTTSGTTRMTAPAAARSGLS